jgi:hypothetical protein
MTDRAMTSQQSGRRVIRPELVDTDEAWPELPWTEWAPTITTLHMWLQIVGKVRMVLAPPLNHWWHVPLYVSSRGLTTSPIPYGRRQFQVEFDFLDHRLDVSDDGERSFSMPLEPKSVARFYREFMDGLRGLGIDVRIYAKPVEVADAIPSRLTSSTPLTTRVRPDWCGVASSRPTG